MLWLVGTGLGTVALAEPRQRCPFEQWPHRAGIAPCTCPPTQNPACGSPAPGSPGRTHNLSLRQSHDEFPPMEVQTRSGSTSSTSTAGDAGCVGAILEPTAIGPR